MALFEQAAYNGDRGSQYQLALIYRDGKGVPVDKAQAYAWLQVASNGGNAEITDARDKVLSSLTPDELNKGQRLAGEISQKLMSKEFKGLTKLPE
jgi:hypothetical protein